jgi:phage-related protein
LTYVKGSNVVVRVVQTFTNAIGSVVSEVSDFVKGIFSSLNNVANTVKNAVGGAVSTIGSWFGGIFERPMPTGTR